MVTIRENGVERKVPADEAFLLQLVTKGLKAGGVMARAALRAAGSRPSSATSKQSQRTIKCRVYTEAGDLRDAIRTLHIATMLDPFRATAQLALEPWVVEAALERLGERQLTAKQQEIVVAATRTPHKVRWPAWWTVRCP
jgi:predicted DNA binding protein